jgi:hypothetical protein
MALCDIGSTFVTRATGIRTAISICLLLVSSCAQNAERDSVCKQSARWNNASTQIGVVLASIESSESGLIQNSFVEVVDALLALNESAPREIKSDVENLLSTYGALSDAFEAIDWQGGLSQKDSAVVSSGVRLASSELQQAQSNLANYISDNCNLQLDNAVNMFPNVGTTLPDPVIQDEQSPDVAVGYDNDESVAQAFGYVVVERFGVAITSEQATCVGAALLVANSGDSQIVDQTYWQLLQEIFNSCDVKIDVAKSLNDK